MALLDRMRQTSSNGPGAGSFGGGGGNPYMNPSNRTQFMQANPGMGGPNFSQGNAYAQSIPQQAGDYDSIMEGYRGILEKQGGDYNDVISGYRNALGAAGEKPEDVAYQEAPEWQGAYGKLRELSETGGLSQADQADLRARGVSPIRAVYANAQRDLDRQRSLSGGSANYNASATKMARELSESVAGQTTNVNAEIAKMVQEGKLKATPEMANMASGKNELMNKVALANQANKSDWQKNQGQLLSGYEGAVTSKNKIPLEALEGMRSLYGTTPALVNTFGNQIQGQQQINNQERDSQRRYRLGGMGAARGGFGGI